ncbi:MAG TPA: hypothetical protein VIL04_08685 [Solirubrobacterales bacterium]|jgi:DNA polymerase-3 subunit delta'
MTASAPTALPPALAEALAEQPAARVALAAALGAPSHAYLFAGAPGSGKRAAARAFAAELLADGAEDPDSARRRALADPSPHPDLTWVRPPGMQHLVDEIRERVIEAAAYRPFEADRRVFVIEAADLMAEESQNALLKTLEEPAPFAHLILVSSQPSALLETVRSRCQTIRFAALSPEAIEARLAAERTVVNVNELELRAAARLSGGDLGLARTLLTDAGRELRERATRLARACRAAALDDAPWKGLLEAAERAGEEAGARVAQTYRERADDVREADPRAAKRIEREGEEAAKRATRTARTSALDAGLALIAAWFRDIAAVGDGASEFILTADRAAELAEDAEGVDPRRARRAGELVMDTRRRLSVHVNEELALEALCFRAEVLLAPRG